MDSLPVSQPSYSIPSHSFREGRDHLLVDIVDHNRKQAEELAEQIGFYGYQVRHFINLHEFQGAITSGAPPSAVIMDASLESWTDNQVIQLKLTNLEANGFPYLFISNQEDIDSRLKAVQNGADAYFTRPVHIGLLVDALDQLILPEHPEPFRIMIVEDSPAQAKVFSYLLSQAGMEVVHVIDYRTLLKDIADFVPDLILMDINMPDYNGLELTRVIRQMEEFVSLPVVYLTSQVDKESQIAALGLGGDDYLTKTIDPDLLIAAVTSRVKRYRKLRSLMVRDSLTGLLNHTTIKERLIQEIARSSRFNKPLAYAMIDLDLFKKINDTHGHAVGDRVIKNLARFLRQRLRKTDSVGRYGGEEFAIILPETSGWYAGEMLDKLRKEFSGIHHGSVEDNIHVTFSCGVASYPEKLDAATLGEAADKMLYEAKRRGRNQVLLA